MCFFSQSQRTSQRNRLARRRRKLDEPSSGKENDEGLQDEPKSLSAAKKAAREEGDFPVSQKRLDRSVDEVSIKFVFWLSFIVECVGILER